MTAPGGNACERPTKKRDLPRIPRTLFGIADGKKSVAITNAARRSASSTMMSMWELFVEIPEMPAFSTEPRTVTVPSYITARSVAIRPATWELVSIGATSGLAFPANAITKSSGPSGFSTCFQSGLQVAQPARSSTAKHAKIVEITGVRNERRIPPDRPRPATNCRNPGKDCCSPTIH